MPKLIRLTWALVIMTITSVPITVWAIQEKETHQNGDPDGVLADWIMKRVIEKALENEKIKRQYITYDKYQITEDLTENPIKKTKETFNIYGDNGRPMERRTEVNQRLVRERGKVSRLDFTDALANKYLPRMVFTKLREEVIDGKGYFVISFKPKDSPDKLPTNDMWDRGINRSIGTLYIDMENFSIWKFESRITGSFSAYVVGQAEEFELNFEQEERFGVVVPKKTTYVIKYSFFWITTHEKRTSTYGNHRDLRNPDAR